MGLELSFYAVMPVDIKTPKIPDDTLTAKRPYGLHDSLTLSKLLYYNYNYSAYENPGSGSFLI